MAIQQIMLGVSPGGEKYWIVTDGSMDTSDNIFYTHMHVDSGGNVYTYGNVVDNNTNPQYYNHVCFHKYDKDGTNLFYKRYQHNTSEQTSQGIGVLTNGQILLACNNSNPNSGSTFLVSSTNGAKQWEKQYGTSATANRKRPRALAVSSSNKILYVQDGPYTGNGDVYIWQPNASGTMIDDWKLATTSAGGPSNWAADPRCAAFDSAGNFYIAGSRGGSGSYNRWGMLIKFDSNMALQWTKVIGQNGSYQIHTFDDIAIDSNDDIILSGSTRPSSPTYGWVVKVNGSGTIQWQKKLDHASGGGNNIELFAVDVDDNDDIYVGGSSDGWGKTPLWAKISSNGTHQWTRYLRDTASNSQNHLRCLKVKDDNIYWGGQNYIGSSIYHGYVAKVPKDGSGTGSYGPNSVFAYQSWTTPWSSTSYGENFLSWSVSSVTGYNLFTQNGMTTDSPNWSEQRVAKDFTA